MASFNERIAVTIDVVTDKATKGLKDFKSSVKEADGVTGKLKAGTKSLGDTFRNSAASPALLAGGVAAVGAAAIQAVGEFSDLGVEIGQFSDATGLAVEDASRWVEVAGDLGLEADTLKSTIGKLNKSIDPALFKELGIEIAKTDDGATDVNATFLNTIARLKSIKDPAERAQVAAKLLGKGWQSSAELIAMSTKDLTERLEAVDEIKVFDKDKVKKARDYRDAIDNLNDSFEAITLEVGMLLAPALSGVASEISNITKVAGPAIKAMEDLTDSGPGGWMNSLITWPTEAAGAIGGLFSVLQDGAGEFEIAGQKFVITNKDVSDTTAGTVSHLRDLDHAARESADGILEQEGAAKRAKDATFKLRDAIEGLNDIQLDSLAAKTDLVTQTFELATAQGDYNDKVDEGKTSTAELAVEANNLAQEAADLAKKQGEVGGHTQTAAERTMTLMTEYDRMQSTLKKGSPLWNAIQAYKDQLLSIPTNIATSVSITGAGRGTANRPSAVTGGGGQTVDGERQTRAATVVNVNVRQLPTERELTDLINQTRRRQGPVI